MMTYYEKFMKEIDEVAETLNIDKAEALLIIKAADQRRIANCLSEIVYRKSTVFTKNI